MALGLPNPFSGEGQQAQIEAVEELYGTVPVYATFSALPNPLTLVDGTIALVLELAENGLPGVVIVRSGSWASPAGASDPTVSFAIKRGAGAGELPEALVVGAGESVPLGATGATPWAIDNARSFARPSDLVVLPANPAAIEIGPRGAGLVRMALQVNYDMTASGSGLNTHFVVQRDQGSGFSDLTAGEIIRLTQSSPISVTGLTQIGLLLNLAVEVGEKFRVVVRHDSNASRTFTFQDVVFASNQLISPLT